MGARGQGKPTVGSGFLNDVLMKTLFETAEFIYLLVNVRR